MSLNENLVVGCNLRFGDVIVKGEDRPEWVEFGEELFPIEGSKLVTSNALITVKSEKILTFVLL